MLLKRMERLEASYLNSSFFQHESQAFIKTRVKFKKSSVFKGSVELTWGITFNG